MNNVKNIVFVPHWVADTLKRNRLPLSSVLDLKVLRQHLSTNDIGSLMAFQQAAIEYMFSPLKGIINGKDDLCYDLLYHWGNSVTEQADKVFLQNTLSVFAGGDDAKLSELLERMADDNDDASDKSEPFITYDLSPEVTAMVIYPSGITHDAKLRVRAVEAILKALYVYSEYHTVARTRWFAGYLELLS